MPASGIYIKEHLYDFHLADIEKVVTAAVKDHNEHGCHIPDGATERAMAKLLKRLPGMIGEFLEEEEDYCPERGIGVKEAA